MGLALEEAAKAAAEGEIPVGAVIVRKGEVIAAEHNSTELDKDASAHAELKAIRAACKALGGWRLPGCAMFVTLEPCAMCSGALVLSRIEELYIGCRDPKAGMCGSLCNIVDDPRLNHQIKTVYGIRQAECSQLLKDFFKNLRQRKKNNHYPEEEK